MNPVYEFFIALVIGAHVDTQPPKIVGRYTDIVECHKAVAQANKEPDMQSKEAKELDAKFVCLRIAKDFI